MKTVKLNDLMVVIFSNRDLGEQNIYDTLETLYNELEDHKLYILDLSEIRRLSEEAAGSLIHLQGYLRDRKKTLRMYRTREQLREVYHKMNLEQVMAMAYNTVSEMNEEDNMVFYFR